MPQTLVPTELTVGSVDAVAAVFGSLRDGGLDAPRAARTACPPRLRRVVAFMSANRAIARVEDALPARDARPRSPVREPPAAPWAAAGRSRSLSMAGHCQCWARRT
jgi:hypothetical protein